MKFIENHDITIGEEMKYTDYQGKQRIGTVVKVYPHFVELRSATGYFVTKQNVDLYLEKGWK